MDFIPFYTHIWSDKKFKILSNEAKILFIYLFTNENITLTGIYSIDMDICIQRVKLTNNFNGALEEIIQGGMVKFDSEQDLIWVVNRFKFIPNKSPMVIRGVTKELEMVDHPFKQQFIEKYRKFIQPYLLNETKSSESDIYETVTNLKRINYKPESIKTFLSTKGFEIERIDEAIKRIFL